ncbi:MAG: hypothetical protein R2826_04665 [Thermoleophilia bacterium]
MLSVEVMKGEAERCRGEEFSLVGRSGRGRVLGGDARSLRLAVNGLFVLLAWGRLDAAIKRLSANGFLSVTELGGGSDAVAVVSALAYFSRGALTLDAGSRLVLLPAARTKPVHQFTEMHPPIERWPRHRRATAG